MFKKLHTDNRGLITEMVVVFTSIFVFLTMYFVLTPILNLYMDDLPIVGTMPLQIIGLLRFIIAIMGSAVVIGLLLYLLVAARRRAYLDYPT